MDARLALGIDVGTHGARAVVADTEGTVVAQAEAAFTRIAIEGLPEGWFEQDPADWWAATRACLRQVSAQLREAGREPDEIAAASVDSTSGTVVLTAGDGTPLRHALMYGDRRARVEADACNDAANAFLDAAGYRFNSSYSLPKLLWLRTHEPDVWRAAAHVLHAADWIAAKLTGVHGVTDQSNALKTGLNLHRLAWPDFIEDTLGIERALLPRVVMSGETVGEVSRDAAEEIGLAPGTAVVAGITDGCADQVASGARRPGDWNTVLGSTLVLKGLTPELLRDPVGRVYCHRHPHGWWMPGGAANVGARAVDGWFRGADRGALERRALGASPTTHVAYPLEGRGERFPFVRPDAEGFIDGAPCTESERYAAALEGVACAERLAYDVVIGLGASVGERIFTTGGGSRSAAWLQIRADMLGRELARAAHANAAMGSAIVAASRTLFPDLAAASGPMVRIETVVRPRPDRARYDEIYQRFRAALTARGWI